MTSGNGNDLGLAEVDAATSTGCDTAVVSGVAVSAVASAIGDKAPKQSAPIKLAINCVDLVVVCFMYFIILPFF